MIVLLRSQANNPETTGKLHLVMPGNASLEETAIDFRYDVLRVWKIPAEELLNGPLALVPLAPVAATNAADAE